jgi:hypothetical protein
MAVQDGHLYYGTVRRDPSGSHAGLHRVSLADGDHATLIEHTRGADDENDRFRTILAIAVHDDYIYWSDARIMRMRLE